MVCRENIHSHLQIEKVNCHPIRSGQNIHESAGNIDIVRLVEEDVEEEEEEEDGEVFVEEFELPSVLLCRRDEE